MATENLHFHEHRVARETKEKRNQHKSRVLWFTALKKIERCQRKLHQYTI